jgi:hypothetical protein
MRSMPLGQKERMRNLMHWENLKIQKRMKKATRLKRRVAASSSREDTEYCVH